MIYKFINRLEQIDQLIRQRRTGNAEEFACKLNISRRQVYNWIDDLRSHGLEIAYSRELRSFIYLKPYKIKIAFEITELSDEEAFNINAGIKILKKSFCAIELHKHNIYCAIAN